MHKLSTMFKKGLKVFFLSVFLATNFLTFNLAEASGPRFNFLSEDHQMFRGSNLTRGEDVWSDPVSGQAGDAFAGLIYYHNGMENTFAENTRIKVTIPAMTENKTAKLSAQILADNAASVSDTLTVNLDADARIEFVPGSVRWFPEAEVTGRVARALPVGQTGDEIINEGINLGQIQGCWQFAGFVSFKFRTIRIEDKIEKVKQAKNLKTNEEGTVISARPGEEVLYTLTTKNTGNIDGIFTVSDDISDILKSAEVVEISDGGRVENNRVVFPEVTIKPDETVVRTFRVRVRSNLDPCEDLKMINIYGNKVIVKITFPDIKKPVLLISKKVRNFTLNETEFKDENFANPGDTLEYLVEFKNLGNLPADKVMIKDILSQYVSYIEGTTVISRSGGSEKSFIDGVVGNGVNIGTIASKEDGYIKFKVIVSSKVADGEILSNTAVLIYEKKEVSDEAKTIIKDKKIVLREAEPILPVTGVGSVLLSLLLVVFSGSFYYYYKKRQQLRKLLA